MERMPLDTIFSHSYSPSPRARILVTPSQSYVLVLAKVSF
jgi:hypothetical protein